MNENQSAQSTTLDDLAAMVARGFEDIASKMATKDDLAETEGRIRAEMATKDDIAQLRKEMSEMKAELKAEIEGLRNSVNNYLHLSDERYLELKHRQDVIVSWIAKIAEKNNVHIDLAELEYK